MQFSSWSSIDFSRFELIVGVGGGEVVDVEDPAASMFFKPSIMFLAIPEATDPLGWEYT